MANDIQLLPDQMKNENNVDSSTFDSAIKLQMKPVGVSGTELYAGYFSEEYLQKLRGRLGAKVFDEMRRSESQVAMLMNAIMNPIKSATWEFEAAPDVVGGDMHKELIEYCAKEMIDWETHLHEALTLLFYGYSLFEVVNNVVYNHPKFGTFNGLKGLAFRSQKTIEKWNVDRGTGELASVTQWVQGDLVQDRSAMIDMPAPFLLVFTLQKEGDNYEGISLLRPMYGPWFRKNLYLKLTAIGIEKNAIGTPMGTIPAGKNKSEDEEKFKEVLSNFTAHELAYLIKPEGWSIEILKNEFDASKVKEMILLENTEMINSVVANFLALGMNGGGGAFALGSDLSDFFLSGIQTYANIVAGVWNRSLIPNLVKMNYGPQSAYPKLKVSGINDKAGKELAEIVKSYLDSGALKPDMKLEEFLRKVNALPKVDPTTVREVAAKPGAGAAVNPNLPPTEAGMPTPTAEVDVQKLSLNGAQVASLLSIVQRVAVGLLPRDTGIEAIATAFNMSTDQAKAIMGSVGHGFVPDAAAVQAVGAQLSEQRLQLAESWNMQWKTNKNSVKDVMQVELAKMLADTIAQVKRLYIATPPASRGTVGLKIQVNATPYAMALRERLAEVANDALIGAKKETPKAKAVKLSERIQLAAPRGGYFDALPAKIKRMVQTQAMLIAGTQASDIEKVVAFQYTSSQASTDSIDQIAADILAAAQPMIEGSTAAGMSVDAAAGNSVSTVSNQARLEWFFEPEVLDTIESFTFYNEDPVSEICQELDDTTWAVGDPDLDRYSPPLHHNCKSRLVPNEKGAEGNPEIDRGGTAVSQKGLDSITLCECHYHIGVPGAG